MQSAAVVSAFIEEACFVRSYSKSRVLTPCKRPTPPPSSSPPKVISEEDNYRLMCQREFKSATRQETESWQEMYSRCRDERDARLKALVEKYKKHHTESNSQARSAVVLTPKECASLLPAKKKAFGKKACPKKACSKLAILKKTWRKNANWVCIYFMILCVICCALLL